MDNLGYHLEEDQKAEFMDHARMVLDFHRGSGESFYDYIPSNGSVFYKHRSGDYKVMSSNLFNRLFQIVYQSEPRYDLSNIDRYFEPIDMSLDHLTGSSMVSFPTEEDIDRVRPIDGNRNIFQFLFGHYELSEMAEKFEKSESLFKNWRQGKTESVNYEILKQTAQAVKEDYEGLPEISPSLIDMNRMKGHIVEDSAIVTDLDLKDIELLRIAKPSLEEVGGLLEDFNNWYETYERSAGMSDAAWYLKWIRKDE